MADPENHMRGLAYIFLILILLFLVIYKESMSTVADYLYINISGLARPQGRYIYTNIMNSTCILKHYQVFSIFFIQISIVRWESIFLTHCIYILPTSITLLQKLMNTILAA